VDVTANLAGLASECGNLSYLTGRPGTDQLIAGVAQQGLWVLGGGSDQWSRLGGGLAPQIKNRTNTIVFDPDVPDRFWESGNYAAPGLVRTTDGGRKLDSLGGLNHLDGFSVDLTDPDRRTMLAGSHEGAELHRSTDAGATWENVAPPLPPNVFATQPLVLDRQTFLLGTADGPGASGAGIFRSTDGGGSWTQVTLGGVAGLPLRAKDQSIYWPLQGGGLARSTDAGVTWSDVTPSGTLSSFDVVELADGRLVSLTQSYAVASSDHGVTWKSLGPTLPTADPYGVAYSEERNAIYVWTWDCGNAVIPGAVQRLDLAPPGGTP
jgi:photosystem II stability/assembly factor-like uncharacterized protein